MDQEVLAVLHENSVLSLVHELVALRKRRDETDAAGDTLDSSAKVDLNLQETIQELKRENGRLCDEIEDLREALGNAEATAERHVKLVDRISDARRPFKHPPNEILRMIFLRAIPPTFLIDSSLTAGLDSPWCEALRMKKSIVEVCKAWWQVGVELLYQEISIRRVGQISALRRTLDATKGIGDLIKSIEVFCFIPSGYLLLFEVDLVRIFELGPRITRFIFGAHASVSTAEHVLSCIGLPSSLHEACSNLTDLQCNSPMDSVHLVSALLVCVNLRSLWICISSKDSPDEVMAIRRPVCLARLQTLRLMIDSTNERVLPTIALHWLMPTLHNVVIDELNSIADFTSSNYREDFFTAFGACLRYLHIRPYRANASTYHIDVQSCIKHCPVLEHLAICPSLRLLTPLSHLTVKWIDLWTSPRGDDENYIELRESLSHKAFPSLIGLRELDHGLSVMTDWPLILPPDSELDVDGVEYRFPGVYVKHTARGIFKMDLIYYGENGKQSEISDGGSFDDRCSAIASDSDSSYIPSDSASDECYSSGGSDADDLEQEEEMVDDVDHDMALTIFAQTHG